MRLNAEGVGCLLIGETMRMRALGELLAAQGVETFAPPPGADLQSSVQEGLRAARRRGGTCVAAEGEMWAAALSLAAQLCVDRVALVAPTDRIRYPKDEFEKQIGRLKGYARRNLFFCVSEVLVLDTEATRGDRRMNAVIGRLCNARVHRLLMPVQRWTNCEFSPLEAAVRFLGEGDLGFSLAK